MKENLRQIAISLVTQYGDEAQTIAMLRAAEYAAILNSVEWAKWEEIATLIETINEQPHDG
jgi:phosphoserine phosphatase